MALTARCLYMTRLRKFCSVQEERTSIAGRLDGLIFMTAKTVLVCHALIVENFSHLVRLVTIHACGKDMQLFFPQLTLNDFPMNLFNLRVTFRTGSSYVPASDG
ncbi:MAG: hypothetical protein AABZ61_01440 [Bacteroidota bacterium]